MQGSFGITQGIFGRLVGVYDHPTFFFDQQHAVLCGVKGPAKAFLRGLQLPFQFHVCGNVFKGQQDPLRFVRRSGYPSCVQEQGAPADAGKIIFHFVVIEHPFWGRMVSSKARREGISHWEFPRS